MTSAKQLPFNIKSPVSRQHCAPCRSGGVLPQNTSCYIGAPLSGAFEEEEEKKGGGGASPLIVQSRSKRIIWVWFVRRVAGLTVLLQPSCLLLRPPNRSGSAWSRSPVGRQRGGATSCRPPGHLITTTGNNQPSRGLGLGLAPTGTGGPALPAASCWENWAAAGFSCRSLLT